MSGTQHPLSQASEGVSDFGRGSASGTRPQGEGPEKDSCSMEESGRAGRGEVRGGSEWKREEKIWQSRAGVSHENVVSLQNDL
jgi:hypothetical protein